MIPREVEKKIQGNLGSGKAVIILGARQTGKTTLLKAMFKDASDILWLNGDEPDTQRILNGISSHQLMTLTTGYSGIIIDEAQRIDQIGLILKRITDNLPQLQVIATGSSSFELRNKLNEPLTGRKWEYQLFPLSFGEMASHTNTIEEYRMLHHRLLFGSYPEIVTTAGKEKELLRLLSDSYLYKDILMLDGINKPEKLVRLLQVLAYQVGSEVSYHELGNVTGLNSTTIEKYIQILEKAFIVFKLGSFHRNLRRELKKSKKIYFYDNGIRNAIIADFSPIATRKDIGALWENYLMSERLKYLKNTGLFCNRYFWRTHDQQEIDYIEEYDGILHAYEFKWDPNKRASLPIGFSKSYEGSTFSRITTENYHEFLLPQGS